MSRSPRDETVQSGGRGLAGALVKRACKDDETNPTPTAEIDDRSSR
jgi:hypothetical protein